MLPRIFLSCLGEDIILAEFRNEIVAEMTRDILNEDGARNGLPKNYILVKRHTCEDITIKSKWRCVGRLRHWFREGRRSKPPTRLSGWGIENCAVSEESPAADRAKPP